MKINKNIFREYDIRGIAGIKFEPKVVAEYEKWYGPFPGTTINLETTKAIGMAYGTYVKRLGGKKVIVGFEIRPYAEQLKEAFIEGINDTGIDVFDAGISTTPIIYFLISHLKLDGGVNITGSHNVYFYNGFKIMLKNTSPLYGEELQKLRKMIEDDDFDLSSIRGNREKMNNGYEIYKEFAVKNIKLKRKIRIVVDCGNGTPGLYVKDYFESLGCELLEGLYLKPDAYFPNHVPDPESPKNLQVLSKRVKELNADLGVGFDADGDRAGFVDENGNYISSDFLILLLARDILSRNPHKKILFDVKCSQLMEEMIPQFGGIPLMHKTGHAPIKDSLRKDPDIVLGGEVSGHFFMAEEYYKIDDGFYATAKILEILSRSDSSFSSIFDFIPKRPRTPEIKLPCEDSIKFDIVNQVKKEMEKKYTVIDIDGARVMFDNKSWGLIRPSNTSPYLTIRFEAPTEARLLELKNMFADILDKYKEIGDKLDRNNVTSLTGKLGYL